MRRLAKRLRHTRAFTLLEMLICAVIIAILATLGVNYYIGAVHAADLRFVMPVIEREIGFIRKISTLADARAIIEFPVSEPALVFHLIKGSSPTVTRIDYGQFASHSDPNVRVEAAKKYLQNLGDTYHIRAEWNLVNAGLLRRQFSWDEFMFPDGSTTPREIAVFPNNSIQDAEVRYGSFFAQAHVVVKNGSVSWKLE